MPHLPTGTITFLFTDIEGSTLLVQGLGDAVSKQVFADHRRLLVEAVEAAGGSLYQDQGESFVFVFSRAKDAVQGAVAAQRALAAHRWPDRRQLRVRMGLHTGEPVGEAGEYVGLDVHRAARVCGAGHGGQILLSLTTWELIADDVPEGITFRDLGEHRLKDLARPHRLFQIVPADLPADFPPLKSRPRTADGLSGLPSIAILPFKTASVDAEQVSLADGLRTDIQYALAKIASLVLIGFATTNTYRNKDVAPQQAAVEMGVRYLLEGFVQKSGDRARITASLIDASYGQVIWSEHYDRVLDDSFEVQDEITEKVVTALDVKLLSGEQAKVWRKTIKNPKAREFFYRGMYEYMKGQREANAAARENFEQVARLAPENALGPTMVAFAHWWDAFRGWTASPARSFELAAQWAERAMAMEDADGQAHTVMAHIHLLRREHDKAREVAEQAVAIRPSCSNANSHLANILYYYGRPADAADRMRQAMRLTPVHPRWFEVILAASCKEKRQWDEAAAVAEQALRLKPDDIDARLVLIEVCRAQGKDSLAREFVQEVSTLWPDFSVSRWAETQPYRDVAVLERIAADLRSAGLAP